MNFKIDSVKVYGCCSGGDKILIVNEVVDIKM